MLLCSGVPLLTAGAAEDSVATAQKAVFQLSEGTLCNAHPEVTADHWRVDIYFDKTLTQEFPTSSSYWNRHLQASTLKDAICSNIRLNGKTLTECLELEAGTIHDGEEKARNIYNAYHVQTVGSNGEVLRIAIPVDNLYGISDTEDFTLQITDGITLNGAALSVATVQYCASTKELTVANASAADAVAHVTGLQLENHESDTCSCGFNGAQCSMVFWTDQPVEPAVNKSFYGRHLTVKAASSTDGMSLVGVALRKRILINGKIWMSASVSTVTASIRRCMCRQVNNPAVRKRALSAFPSPRITNTDLTGRILKSPFWMGLSSTAMRWRRKR